jgi:predicted dinucleotide-binding enzyme
VGKALGEGWAGKHTVVYLKRATPQDERKRALAEADAVLLATSWKDARAAVEGQPLAGKILIDATNALKPDLSGLAFGHDTSAAEQIAGWAGGARVVKAFNTCGFDIMADPRFGERGAVMPIAGDDADAKRVVGELAADLGFEPLDAGPLQAARLLEPLAMLWVSLAVRGGMGRQFAFGLLRR